MLKRVVAIILVALALSPATATPPPPQITQDRAIAFWGAGQLEQVHNQPVLHLRGTPYEMGYQQGALLHTEIRALLRAYLYQQVIVEGTYSHLLLRDYARQQEPYIPADYRAEMRGVAAGAGVAYWDIVTLNILFDLFHTPRGSSFAVWDAATADAELLHGVNLDLPQAELLARYTTVKFYYPTHGHNFVAVNWAGICGVFSAVNDQGISLNVISTPSRDTTENGIPIGFLLRDAIQHAADENEVLTTIARAPRAAGYSIVVGLGKQHRAMAVEFSAHRYAEITPTENYLIHTAHYRDAELFAWRGESAPDDPSWRQYERLTQLIQDNYGWLAPRKALELLHDQQDGAVFNADTLYSVVMQPTDGKLWLTPQKQTGASAALAPVSIEFDLLHELGYR